MNIIHCIHFIDVPVRLIRGVRLIKVSFTVNKGKKIKLGTLATVALTKGVHFIEVSLYKAKAMAKLVFIMSNENCYQIRNPSMRQLYVFQTSVNLTSSSFELIL